MNTNTVRINSSRFFSLALSAGFLLLTVIASRALDGIWSADSDGSWSDTAKWAGGTVADGTDSTAYLTNDITAIRFVTVDLSRTNGNLIFGDGNTGTPGGWNLNAANTVTLATSVGTPVISVGTINPQANTNDAWISSLLAGSQGFIKKGPGTLSLAGNNTLLTNGGIIVQEGMLMCATAGAFGPTSIAKTNQFDGGVVRLVATPNNHTWLVTANGGTLVLTNTGALNFNSQIVGSGTLYLIASNMLTFGNNSGNGFSNFTGTLDMNGTGSGGNARFDPGNGNANLGNPGMTVDLGTNNAVLFTRYNLAGGTNTVFIGALKGGSNTTLRATGQGLAGGSTTIFQIGSLNVPTTFAGVIRNGLGAGVQAASLTKVGTSSFTLDNATNIYTGATVVSNGSLVLTATGAISNSVSITTVGSGVFDVSAYGGLWVNAPGQILGGSGTVTGSVTVASGFLSPGVGPSIGRLTFANNLTVSGTMTNLFKTGFGTNDSILVSNNLVLSGITTVQIIPPAGASLIPNGTYPLFKWNGTLTGDTNNLALAYPAQVITASLVLQTNLATKTISLVVSGNSAGALTWRGDGTGNAWNHTTPNWRTSGGGASLFSELDAATFDEFGSNNVPVNIAETVTPSSLTVNTTNRDYIFSGGGNITGVTTLSKNGPGKLTVLQNNDFSGTVSINGGTIQIGDGAANASSGSLGTGPVVNNSRLVYNRSDTVTLPNALQGGGTLVQDGTNVQTTAVGVLILTADNNANNVLVANGTLQLGDGTSGQGSVTGTITNNATLSYSYNNDVILKNSLSGNGVINYLLSAGNRTYTFPLNLANAGFSGTMNLAAGVRLHSDTGNAGHILGNGSVVNVPAGAQAWVDSSASNYTCSFVIAGNGWGGDALPFGALRIFNCTLAGPITMTADSRIGGSSSGATIQGQISGPYQLEILGTTAIPDNFVLTLTPSNGPNAFNSTLVTRGVLQAGNTNAFTNAITMTAESRMRLNGNDITIASLSGGTPANGTNCLVWNNSTTSGATLTVGGDGGTTTFEGIFANGATQPLGLTKIGAGTLNLTAVSSNTGAVTVSGGAISLLGDASFTNSTLLSVASGATLDVSGRTDGTLTLYSGQTLKGGGTVNGILIASAGSTVAPGNSVGTLNVVGNANLGGTLAMELNRTNTPSNCDHLTASGSISYGGILTVTNIGPALQTNDTFQLFPAGVSGFATIILATNDANNKIYTFQNNINTLGSIKVLTVALGVNLTPTNITYSLSGTTLSLAWPGDHLGWLLQTNAVGLLSTNAWFPYPGSTLVTNVNITINSTRTNVFFRLRSP